MITPSIEKILLNFASYSSLIGRNGYSESLKETLLLPEPEKSSQLNILKSTIIEIFNISSDNSEFRDFVDKYNLTADGIKEFLIFLGPDSGLKYFNEEDSRFVTVSSFLKSKLEERFYGEVILFIKIQFGKKTWEEYEYAEADSNKVNNLLVLIDLKSNMLASYIQSRLFTLN